MQALGERGFDVRSRDISDSHERIVRENLFFKLRNIFRHVAFKGETFMRDDNGAQTRH
jgi:hypothetical protein